MNQKVEIKEDDLQRLILKVEALTDAILQLVNLQHYPVYVSNVTNPPIPYIVPTVFPLTTAAGLGSNVIKD